VSTVRREALWSKPSDFASGWDILEWLRLRMPSRCFIAAGITDRSCHTIELRLPQYVDVVVECQQEFRSDMARLERMGGHSRQ
jgi:hypothetical protein